MTKPIQVFLRHCYYSKLQELPDRKRPFWFNKHKVFQNFKNTIDKRLADYHIIYDDFYGDIKDTFLKDELNIKVITCGTECDSFIKTMEYVKYQNYTSDTIIYFLEDDYLHKSGWCKILLEGFSLNPDYITLYPVDLSNNEEILYKIFTTKNTYWRVLPVTTNTFACKYSTLLKDYEIHKKYSEEMVKIKDEYYFSKDYDKFWKLGKDHQKYIISTLPGYSTHCDDNYLTPFINWEEIINKDKIVDVFDKKKFVEYE